MIMTRLSPKAGMVIQAKFLDTFCRLFAVRKVLVDRLKNTTATNRRIKTNTSCRLIHSNRRRLMNARIIVYMEVEDIL